MVNSRPRYEYPQPAGRRTSPPLRHLQWYLGETFQEISQKFPENPKEFPRNSPEITQKFPRNYPKEIRTGICLAMKRGSLQGKARNPLPKSPNQICQKASQEFPRNSPEIPPEFPNRRWLDSTKSMELCGRLPLLSGSVPRPFRSPREDLGS